jgi:hypothetical protein
VVYIAFATSLQALMPRARRLALAGLVVCLAAANFVNPIYPFPFENNLAFASFVDLEEEAAYAVEQRGDALPDGGNVATVFPVGNALRNPQFGFVQVPRKVLEMSDFGKTEVERIGALSPEMVVVYQREWDPLRLLARPGVREFLSRYYGYKPEMNAEEIATALSMRVGRRWKRRGLTMELLERDNRP